MHFIRALTPEGPEFYQLEKLWAVILTARIQCNRIWNPVVKMATHNFSSWYRILALLVLKPWKLLKSKHSSVVIYFEFYHKKTPIWNANLPQQDCMVVVGLVLIDRDDDVSKQPTVLTGFSNVANLWLVKWITWHSCIESRLLQNFERSSEKTQNVPIKLQNLFIMTRWFRKSISSHETHHMYFM